MPDALCLANGRCVVDGRCTLEGERCIAASEIACRQSLGCALFGRCEHLDEACFASERGCGDSLACSLHGYCTQASPTHCRNDAAPPTLPPPTIVSPAMRSALDRPFDAGWIVGKWLARPPMAGADSYTWQADLEIRADGSFELTEGEVYPDKDQCTLAGDVRVADFVMIQRVIRSSCPEIPPGTLRTFAAIRDVDAFSLRELFVSGSDPIQSTGYRPEGRTGSDRWW